MPTSTFVRNVIDILSYLVPSFPPILTAIPSQLHPTDTRRDIVTSPASPQHCVHPRPIPPKRFLGRLGSNPSFKSAAADPLLSFESSATIAPMARVTSTPGAADSLGDFSEGDAHRYGCGRERETDIDVDISASSFNISLVSDTSTSTSTSSSSTEDLPLSLAPPPQPLLPSIRVFPSQHPEPLLNPRSFSTPEDYPYTCSTHKGVGLGLGISIPSKDSSEEGNVMVPLGGLGFGLVGLGGRRSRTGYAYAWPWLYPEEEEEEDLVRDDDDEIVSDKMLNEILWTWTADPLHVLCTIPECEEDQDVDMDVKANSRDRSCDTEACEAGQSPILGYFADRLKESVPKRVTASISSEAKRTLSCPSSSLSLLSSSALPRPARRPTSSSGVRTPPKSSSSTHLPSPSFLNSTPSPRLEPRPKSRQSPGSVLGLGSSPRFPTPTVSQSGSRNMSAIVRSSSLPRRLPQASDKPASTTPFCTRTHPGARRASTPIPTTTAPTPNATGGVQRSRSVDFGSCSGRSRSRSSMRDSGSDGDGVRRSIWSRSGLGGVGDSGSRLSGSTCVLARGGGPGKEKARQGWRI